MSMAALREGLAGVIEAAIPEGVQISAYALSAPVAPGVQILPGEIDYDLAFHRGWDLYSFKVQVFVDYSTDVGSQVFLDEFLDGVGAKSLKQIIEADPTLGGASDNARVLQCSGYRVVDRATGGQLIVAEFTVEIRVSNNLPLT